MTTNLQTLFTGRQTTYLETVNSTNSFMNNLVSNERLPEGAVVLAHEQTSGRGQASTSWFSDPGKNLLMSVIYYPSFLSTQNLFMLSKAFSLAVFDYVLHTLQSREVKIKWPNDIYYRNSKLCGILIENSIRNPNLNHTLLGIGLNVNQEIFPSNLPNPVSLKMILGKELNINDCLHALCNTLESRYLQLKSGQVEKINEDYLRSLFRYGEFHEYENSREKFKAKITAIADDGKIFLKRDNGLIEKYDFKEMKFLI
jgi:BirA family biotin operon repressor/biotin-[acetyl-CoA-carboxylase] ligase